MQKSRYGLIGFPLGHSFSKTFYDQKIQEEKISHVEYGLYPLERIALFPDLVNKDPWLKGVNVTIPHKIAVLDYLDEVSREAREIGAVNCIKICREADGKPFLKGYNTDVYGFEMSLRPLLRAYHRQALVLGSGGAARAVCYVLDKLGITWRMVSRHPAPGTGSLAYEDLDEHILSTHRLIINTTPLGTYPDVGASPMIPYHLLGTDHLLYDLVYNPQKTTFLRQGEAAGSTIKNGYEMLVLQAERNWEIWTGEDSHGQTGDPEGAGGPL